MLRSIAALVAAFFIWCSLPAAAAITGVVMGTVHYQGKPEGGATVTLTGEGSKFSRTTDSRGSFSFPNVPFGHYHLNIYAKGASDRTIDLDVASGAVARLDIALDNLKEIGNASVTAHAGVTGTPIGLTTITKNQIATSPNRYSLNRLIETSPGIVAFSYNEPVAHGFHGLTYELDGAPLPQATATNFSEIIDPRSIDSLEVFTGAIPAEYGGTRQGAVVNIVTSRLDDVAPGSYGTVSGGIGNYASSLGSLDELARFGSSEITLALNTQRTNRGIDSPTFDPIHDNSSQSDGFFRFLTQLDKQSTLAFDATSSFSLFQIPINTDPNNTYDPIYAVPGTDDVQGEYNRFASLNYTRTSKNGLDVFQFIPWVRYTRISYSGDLANDVLALAPNTATDITAPAYANQVGLDENRVANYVGIRTSQLWTSDHHAVKVGLDASRETLAATQTFACYTPDCNLAPSTPPPAPATPGYYAFNSAQDQAGAQIGLYAQDNWQPSRNLGVQYGVRYDHSTGYVGGYAISPRVGVNMADGHNNIFHVFYGRFYAAPQLEDVRQDCVLLNGCSGLPVYDLQPEHDAYYEAGIARQFNNHMKGYVNFFSRSVTNVLDTTQFLNTPLFAVYNNSIGIDNGVEMRLDDQLHNGDSWYVSGTFSGSYAGGISGATFLFPPSNGLTPQEQLAPEDHDQTVAAVGGYTHRFGADRSWYASLQGNYGTGYPVAFQDATQNLTGRLPTHLTFDVSVGHNLKITAKSGLGMNLDIVNLLNHQYVLKIANGFNTTQIAPGRQILFSLTQPF